MPTFKLTIAYDGAAFVGWQRQAAGVSVQGLLEDAFAELDGRPVPVVGAGRTDAGVHALGQVAGVALARNIDALSVKRAINTRLPETVRVMEVRDVPAAFHARFDARAKSYRYRIWNAEVTSPFERAYSWHVPPPPLDLGAMAAAAALLEGRHDFAAFQAAGADPHDTHRTIFSSRICHHHSTLSAGSSTLSAGSSTLSEGSSTLSEGSSTLSAGSSTLVEYEIRGDGFLRHMVRTIVGTLVEIGRGRQPPEWMRDVLAARDRTRAGRTAPAEGLFLVSVDYE
jgi:tRNA pseudouridine38-40 synthase